MQRRSVGRAQSAHEASESVDVTDSELEQPLQAQVFCDSVRAQPAAWLPQRTFASISQLQPPRGSDLFRAFPRLRNEPVERKPADAVRAARHRIPSTTACTYPLRHWDPGTISLAPASPSRLATTMTKTPSLRMRSRRPRRTEAGRASRRRNVSEDSRRD